VSGGGGTDRQKDHQMTAPKDACTGCGRTVRLAQGLCMVCQVYKRAETAKGAREVFREMRDKGSGGRRSGPPKGPPDERR
jgi:hypothetical protein